MDAINLLWGNASVSLSPLPTQKAADTLTFPDRHLSLSLCGCEVFSLQPSLLRNKQTHSHMLHITPSRCHKSSSGVNTFLYTLSGAPSALQMCLPAAIVLQHNARHSTCFPQLHLGPGFFFLFSLVLSYDPRSEELRWWFSGSHGHLLVDELRVEANQTTHRMHGEKDQMKRWVGKSWKDWPSLRVVSRSFVLRAEQRNWEERRRCSEKKGRKPRRGIQNWDSEQREICVNDCCLSHEANKTLTLWGSLITSPT